MEEALLELVEFLSSPQPEVRKVAVENIAAQSTNGEAIEILQECPSLFQDLIRLTADLNPIARHAFTALINFCERRQLALTMINHTTLIQRMCEVIRDKESSFIELSGMLLSNLTRYSDGCSKLLQVGDRLQGLWMCQLLDRFVKDKESEALSWVALSVMNATQMEAGQHLLLDHQRRIIANLLPFMHHPNVVRRRGVLGSLKNCCFVEAEHEYLLGPEVDILPHLLTPLVIDEKEYDGEDKDLIPKSVRAVMVPEKQREEDVQCRLLVVEALFLLSKRRFARELMRSNGVYIVIRELDKWEPDAEIKEMVLRLVNHLIPDESDESATTSAVEEAVVEAVEEAVGANDHTDGDHAVPSAAAHGLADSGR